MLLTKNFLLLLSAEWTQKVNISQIISIMQNMNISSVLIVLVLPHALSWLQIWEGTQQIKSFACVAFYPNQSTWQKRVSAQRALDEKESFEKALDDGDEGITFLSLQNLTLILKKRMRLTLSSEISPSAVSSVCSSQKQTSIHGNFIYMTYSSRVLIIISF